MLVCIIGLSNAQPGKVDTSYYKGMGFCDQLFDLVVLPDSSTIIAGTFRTVNQRIVNRICKLKADGSTDHSFDPGTGLNSWGRVIRMQSDGKIVVGGDFTTYNGTGRNRLARLSSSGTLDGTFTIGTGFNNSVYDIYVQSDSKLVVTGSFTTFNGTTVGGIVRLNTDGSRDTSFHSGTGANSEIHAVDRASDGTFIISGNFTSFNGTTVTRIAKLNSDGSLDASFNSGGSGANANVYDVLFLPNGKVVAAGDFTTFNGATATRIVRLKTNGTMDSTFTTGSGFNIVVAGLALQSDGKILAAGSFSSYNGASINRIARIDTTGSRDTTFAPGVGFDNLTYNVILNPDNKMYVAGGYYKANNYLRLFLTRLNANGSVDPSFFAEAKVNDAPLGASLQSTGKLIVGGYFTNFGTTTVNRIMRLTADGNLDTTFQSGTGANGTVRAVYVLPNDKILIGGDFTSYNGTTINRIARLNSNGTLDTSFQIGTGANWLVYSIAVNHNGKIYLGGDFTSVNGVTKNRIVGLNSNGSIDAAFNIGTGYNGIVYDIKIQNDSKLMVGGAFSTYNGSSYNRVMRLDTIAAVDGTFNPGTGPNGDVNALAFEASGKIFIGGGFSSYNGTNKNKIVRVSSTGTLDSTFSASITHSGGWTVSVTNLLPYNNRIIAGGGFDRINGATKVGIGVMDSTGAVDTYIQTGVGIAAGGANVSVLVRDTVNQRILFGGVMVRMDDLYLNFGFSGLFGVHDYGVKAIDSVRVDSSLCAGETTKVYFKKKKQFNPNNVFTAQLDYPSGTYTGSAIIGTKTSGGVGWDSISITIPEGAAASAQYKIRVATTNPIYTSDTSNDITVWTLPSPPPAPDPLIINTDSATTFVFDSIITGYLADQVQWSWSSNFDSCITLNDGDSLIGQISAELTDTIWLRSKQSYTGCVSLPAQTSIKTVGGHKLLSNNCEPCNTCDFVDNGCFESHAAFNNGSYYDAYNNFENVVGCWGIQMITPDYFNDTHTSPFYDLTGSPTGYQAQQVHGGSNPSNHGFIGMWNDYSGVNEAAYVNLNAPLISGINYTFSFYVKVSSVWPQNGAPQRKLRLKADIIDGTTTHNIYTTSTSNYILEYPCPNGCSQPSGYDNYGWIQVVANFTAPSNLSNGTQRLVLYGLRNADDSNISSIYYNLDDVSITPSLNIVAHTTATAGYVANGTTVTFQAQVCNNSDDDMNFVISDNLVSQGFSYVTSSSNLPSSYSSGVLTFNTVTINSGDCENFTFQATYTGSSTCSPITNAVTIATSDCIKDISVDWTAASSNILFSLTPEGETHYLCSGLPSSYVIGTPIPSGLSSPYSVSWTPAVGLNSYSAANPTLTSLAITSTAPYYYTATITNSVCSTTTYHKVYIYTQVTPSYQVWGETCDGWDDGRMQVTPPVQAVAPLTYIWSNGGPSTPTRLDLAPGNYSVTLTDANGCSGSVSATVSSGSTEPTVTFSGITGTCTSGGTATVNVSGGTTPYSYQWTTGGTSTSISGVPRGTYYVQVTSGSCVTFNQVIIPSGLTLSTSYTQPTCSTATGSVTITPSGGTPNYTYTWNVGIGVPITVSGAHTYSNLGPSNFLVITVTDATNCSASVNLVINDAHKFVQFIPSSGGAVVSDMYVDPANNDIYVIGCAETNVYMPTAGNFAPTTEYNPSENEFGFLAKYDECGVMEWNQVDLKQSKVNRPEFKYGYNVGTPHFVMDDDYIYCGLNYFDDVTDETYVNNDFDAWGWLEKRSKTDGSLICDASTIPWLGDGIIIHDMAIVPGTSNLLVVGRAKREYGTYSRYWISYFAGGDICDDPTAYVSFDTDNTYGPASIITENGNIYVSVLTDAGDLWLTDLSSILRTEPAAAYPYPFSSKMTYSQNDNLIYLIDGFELFAIDPSSLTVVYRWALDLNNTDYFDLEAGESGDAGVYVIGTRAIKKRTLASANLAQIWQVNYNYNNVSLPGIGRADRALALMSDRVVFGGDLAPGAGVTLNGTTYTHGNGSATGQAGFFTTLERLNGTFKTESKTKNLPYKDILSNFPKKDEKTDNNFMQLFPNPTNSQVFVEITSKGVYTIDVYDNLGEKIVTKEGTNTSLMAITEIDLSAYSSGFYLIKVTSGNVIQTGKVALVK